MSYRVLLVNPNYQKKISAIAQISVGPPLGLAYIASILRSIEDVEVRLLDANALRLSDESIVMEILDFNPNLVGFTATTPTIRRVADLITSLKKASNEIKTVVGGAHPTIMPKETLGKYPIDFLVYGEGEYTFHELVKALKEKKSFAKIKGLCYKKNDRIIKNPPRQFIEDLDNLPFPARDLLPNHLYRSPDSNHFTCIMAMRGCPANCIYCSVKLVAGTRLRKRTVENVVDEIEECLLKYKINFFSFLDDTFTYDRRWIHSLCKEIIQRGLNKKVRWICLTRVDCVDINLLKSMKDAGCVKIEFGIESGSATILKYIQKGITTKQIKNAFGMAKKTGLRTMAFIMLNAPLETKDTIRETRELIFELNPDFLQISYMTPYPGTELYKQCSDKKLIKTDNWEDYVFLNRVVINNPNISEQELINAKKKIEKDFYLRPKYLIMRLNRILKREENFTAIAWASLNALAGFLSK